MKTVEVNVRTHITVRNVKVIVTVMKTAVTFLLDVPITKGIAEDFTQVFL